MKTSVICLLGMAFTFSTAFAVSGDKATEKARQAVEKAAPDDWETLAEAAQLCIRKKVNLKEAKTWLDESLSIKESILGLEVAGDYYMLNKLYDKAIKSYVKSMLLLKKRDNHVDIEHLQDKIRKATKLSKR